MLGNVASWAEVIVETSMILVLGKVWYSLDMEGRLVWQPCGGLSWNVVGLMVFDGLVIGLFELCEVFTFIKTVWW